MLKDKVVLVTGAFGGIGKQLVLHFARAGSKVVMWDMAVDEEFLTGLHESGAEYLTDRVDITGCDEIAAAAGRIVDKFGTIDVLINNAGITKDKLIFKMEEADWDKVLDVNLKGAFLCSKIVGRIMFSQKQGRIINISSIIGQIGNIGQANYSASKGGLISLTKTCAKEFGRFGVAVNAVAPGYIVTKMTEELPVKVKDEMLKQITLKRFGRPEDVADAVVFLASEESAYITGQVIRVDGGLVM